MDIEIIRNPEVIVLRNFFTKEKNLEIFKEVVSNQNHFIGAAVGHVPVVNLEMRSNISCMYDLLYNYNRDQSNISVLLEALYSRFLDQELHAITYSANSDIKNFDLTMNSEIQVSRYGDDNQKYDWHHDSMGKLVRMVTLVYYVFKEPQEFKGGEICFTNGVINNGKIVDQTPKPEIITIKPENNMAVLFSSKLAHAVMPTSSPKSFANGRFSVNCWLGIK